MGVQIWRRRLQVLISNLLGKPKKSLNRGNALQKLHFSQISCKNGPWYWFNVQKLSLKLSPKEQQVWLLQHHIKICMIEWISRWPIWFFCPSCPSKWKSNWIKFVTNCNPFLFSFSHSIHTIFNIDISSSKRIFLCVRNELVIE